MSRIRCSSLLIAGLIISPCTWSQSSSLDAHIHGEAELTIAFDGKHLEMQLLSPAANILGFEHAPANDEQRERVHHAENILQNANALFEFRGTDCASSFVSVEMPYKDLSQHKHRHDNSHAHGRHTEEGHESHSEVVANYVFTCDSSQLARIQVLLLDEFPAIENLDAQWITSIKQGAQELSANKPWIDLR